MKIVLILTWDITFLDENCLQLSLSVGKGFQELVIHLRTVAQLKMLQRIHTQFTVHTPQYIWGQKVMFTEASEQQFLVDARKFLPDIGYVLDMVHDTMNATVLQRLHCNWLWDSFRFLRIHFDKNNSLDALYGYFQKIRGSFSASSIS